MKKTISVIGPLYNEESLVLEYVQEVLKVFQGELDSYNLELVLVDDGSKDDTYKKMCEAQDQHPSVIKTVKLSRNFGLEAAIDSGLKASTGDAVVVMDADLQDPPSVIIKLVSEWENGFDVVSAVRKARPNDSFFKKTTASIYYSFLKNLSGKVPIDKEAANFKLLSRRAVDKLLDLNEVNTVFRVLVPFIGLNATKIYYERDKRFSGTTKYNLASMIPYALDSITGLSVAPLRKGYLLVVIGILLTVSMAMASLLSDDNGIVYFTLSFISLLWTLSAIFLSVIAEYIAQINIEVKGRPTSIVDTTKDVINTECDHD